METPKNQPFSHHLSRAVAMSVQAHGDQSYGDQPYISHLMEVDRILCEFGYSDTQTRICGYLHDTLEDTSLHPQKITDSFGEPTRRVVAFCSDEKGSNRKERKANTYARVRKDIEQWEATQIEVLHWALRTKLADRLANFRACWRGKTSQLSMYQKEGPSFREAYFVPGVCDAMWAEYDRLVGEV